MIKLGELVMILDLHRQGLSVSAIARQVGVDRKTVRNCLAKGLQPPTYKKRAPAPGVIDGFEPYLLLHSLRAEPRLQWAPAVINQPQLTSQGYAAIVPESARTSTARFEPEPMLRQDRRPFWTQV